MAASIPIVCPYCGVGCNLDLALDETGRPVKCRATGRNPELNAKYACVKGFTVHELLNHAERLTQPYIRKADQLEMGFPQKYYCNLQLIELINEPICHRLTCGTPGILQGPPGRRYRQSSGLKGHDKE